jgi:hypothetical protein
MEMKRFPPQGWMDPAGVFSETPSGSSIPWLPAEGQEFGREFDSLLKEIYHLHSKSGRNIVNENLVF